MFVKVSTKPFISALSDFVKEDKSKVLIVSIAMGIIFSAVIYWACQYYWKTRKVEEVASPKLEKKVSEPIPQEKTKPFIDNLLDEAFRDIKKLTHELDKAKKDVSQAQVESDKAKQLRRLEKKKSQIAQEKAAKLAEENERLKKEKDDLLKAKAQATEVEQPDPLKKIDSIKPEDPLDLSLEPASFTIPIMIKNIVGKFWRLEAVLTETVFENKKRYQLISDFPADKQRWVRAGRELEDGKKLSDCHVQKDDTIHVLLKLRDD